MDIRRYQPQLTALFDAHGVILAYLFGSQVKGTANRESDIDIAVLLSDQVPQAEYGAWLVKLNTDLIGVFQQDRIDVALLNCAPPLLAFRVVRDGVPIYDPHDQHVSFYVKTFNRYVDTQPLRDVQWQYYLKRQRAHAQSSRNDSGAS